MVSQDALRHIVGRRLRLARRRKYLTQETLAERLAVGQDTISKYEQGKRMPSLMRLGQLAEILDVDLGYFLPDEMQDQIEPLQAETLALYHTLSPLAREYVLVFVEHVALMQQRRRFLTEEVLRHANPDERLRIFIERDLDQFENTLKRQPANARQVSLETLVGFTALALVGMELESDTSDLTQRLTGALRPRRGGR